MSYVKRYLESEVDRIARKYGKDWYDVMMLANEMIETGELDLSDFSKLEAKVQN